MSQLRSFKALKVTTPQVISTIPCNLADLDGVYDGAGNEYLQIFDLAVAPTTNVTVPLKTLLLQQAGPIPSLFQQIGPIRLLTGLVVAISTTEEKFVTSASQYSIEGELEEWEFPRDSAQVAGDLTTSVATRQVWTEAAGPKTLKRLQITEKNGVASFIQLFFIDNPANGNVPDLQIPLAANASVDLYYQLVPFRKDTGIASGSVSGLGADLSIHQGLTVAISLTAGQYDTAGLATIRAEYFNSGTFV